MTLQSFSYAPLPSYVDSMEKRAAVPPASRYISTPSTATMQGQMVGPLVVPTEAPFTFEMPPVLKESWEESQYAMGDTEDAAEYDYESYIDIPVGSKSDNNTFIIAMSVASGGLLLIIIMMLFFVKPKRSK
jgi:hypothetical protein